MWDEEPLNTNWRETIELIDPISQEARPIEQIIQQYADIALTKYYDFIDGDYGLMEDWLELSDKLSQAQQFALLGSEIIINQTSVDPGGMGTYFQNPHHVINSSTVLQDVHYPQLDEFKSLLDSAIKNNKGLMVTF